MASQQEENGANSTQQLLELGAKIASQRRSLRRQFEAVQSTAYPHSFTSLPGNNDEEDYDEEYSSDDQE